MSGVLVIVPCGQGKIWDQEPWRGPTPAREAYTGAPFKVNRQYAERFAGRWVILSAKYGFMSPEFFIPGPYNVTFKKTSTNPVSLSTLRTQIEEQALDRFKTIIVLGGKEYRKIVADAFTSSRARLHFPFAGLPIGKAMQATKRAMEIGEPLPHR